MLKHVKDASFFMLCHPHFKQRQPWCIFFIICVVECLISTSDSRDSIQKHVRAGVCCGFVFFL